jgi:hypothetical protein
MPLGGAFTLEETMTGMAGRIRMVTMAAVLVLCASVASPQSPPHGHATGPDPAHGRQAQPSRDRQSMAAMHKDMLGQMAADDARLEALVADMNMFTGDLKIEAIAEVVTLLVERQSMMRQHLTKMHDQMMWNMVRSLGAPPTNDLPDIVTPESEPAEMCQPPTQ